MSENTLTDRAERAVADLESAAAFLRSSYFEGLVARQLAAAVTAAQSPWLDRAAAAAYARCSVSEIDRVAALGVFQTYPRGGRPMFKRSEVDAAIATGKWPAQRATRNAEHGTLNGE